MAHTFEKKTRTFFGRNRFEQRFKTLIELLLVERSELKAQIAELRDRQQILETQFEVSLSQTRATQHICRETQNIVDSVLEMTRNLAMTLSESADGPIDETTDRST